LSSKTLHSFLKKEALLRFAQNEEWLFGGFSQQKTVFLDKSERRVFSV
jgi:hypothetical protein